jgi:hypothetical protein
MLLESVLYSEWKPCQISNKFWPSVGHHLRKLLKASLLMMFLLLIAEQAVKKLLN